MGPWQDLMSTALRITAGTGLHKGDRDYQQDQVGLLQHAREPRCLLGVVADGMGGRSGGRKASDQVLMTAKQLFERFDPSSDDPTEMLHRLAQEAHMVIRLTAVSAEQEPHSTLAAFLLTPDGKCHWAHAGDSRVYHYRMGQMLCRTIDHSYVQSLVDQGLLTEQQAQNHPQSNVLLGCLGTEADPPIAIQTLPSLGAGDTLMACSDGVWHYFSEREIGEILRQYTAKAACERLVALARVRANGFGDNLSVIVVKFELSS